MLYLQRYLTNFQKLFFGWKKRKLAIAVENFKCTEIWFSNSNVTTFSWKWLYTVAAEMPYLQKYLTNFQKLFFRWKKRKVAIVVGKFQVHRHFLFSNGNVTTFPTSQKCKNLNFFLLHCPGRNGYFAYLQRYLTNFQKLFWLKEEEEDGYSGWKFQVHRHFRFPMATLRLFQHPENVKISIFPFTLSRQKCHISRSI